MPQRGHSVSSALWYPHLGQIMTAFVSGAFQGKRNCCFRTAGRLAIMLPMHTGIATVT